MGAAAGVSDPVAAVRAIKMSHTAIMFMQQAAASSQNVAVTVENWKDSFGNLIARLNGEGYNGTEVLIDGLNIVGKSLLLIGNGYLKQVQILDDKSSKQSIIISQIKEQIEGEKVQLKSFDNE